MTDKQILEITDLFINIENATVRKIASEQVPYFRTKEFSGIMFENEKYINEERLNQEFIFEFIKLRHELGLTQVEMAKKANVLRDKIAKIEAGIYPPNIKSLFKILGPLGYTIKIEKIEEDTY